MYTFSIHSGKRTRAVRGFLTASVALSVCLLAGCGSSSKSTSPSSTGSSGSGGTATADVAAAQKRLEPYLKAATTIEVTTPLTRKPDAGKSAVLIRYNLPIAAELDAPFKAATQALGWKGTVVPIDATDPQSTSNAMLRAVSQGVNYIAVNSGSVAGMGPGLAAAKNAGIPVFLNAGVGDIQGAANGIYGNTEGSNVEEAVLRLLDNVIVDSKGTGTALLVNAPDFPILTPLDPAAKKHIAASCSGCSLQTLDISAANLGGDLASGTVAAIRANPKIKYVVASFDGLVGGLPQALKAAGLSDVQVFICIPTPPTVQQIAQGDYAAGMVAVDLDRTWLLVDQMARQSVGMDVEQSKHALLAMQLWNSKTVPKGATSWDPPNFEAQYKALWHVS